MDTDGDNDDKYWEENKTMLIHSCTIWVIILAMRIAGRPIHAIQVTRPSVRILQQMNVNMAETATKTAVQAPWVEIAFRLIDTPRMAEPLTNIQYVESQTKDKIISLKDKGEETYRDKT